MSDILVDARRYRLGPNGGILTALNLFTTKFDQVLGYVEKRAPTVDHIVVDTPGQIEIFTWSASGAIITDSMASTMPCCIAYIIDTARTASPTTFMSNMLYACSILYKTRLPFILVFNKTDVQDHHFALEWMQDFEKFQAALNKHRDEANSDDGPSYMNSLMNSMSLVLDQFYQHLKTVGVSAMTGDGIDDFLNAVDEAREEYERCAPNSCPANPSSEYRPELERIIAERDAKKELSKQEQLSRLVSDMQVSGATRQSSKPAAEDEIESDDDWDEGPDAERTEAETFAGQKRTFGGIEEDGLGNRWPAPRP